MKRMAFILTKCFLLITIMLSYSELAAQQKPYTPIQLYDNQEANNYFECMIAADMASRNEPARVLPIEQFLLLDETTTLWTDGINLYRASYIKEDRQVYFEYRPIGIIDIADIDESIFLKSMKVNGKKVTTKDKPALNVNIEQLGNHIMLVGRDAQGRPMMALYSVTKDQLGDNTWTSMLQCILMGNYTIQGKQGNAVFGPKMPFYSGEKYDTDPCFLSAYYSQPKSESIDILYGGGRVSKGDPSSPKWGKMPGGGGAGAIMGPMEWNIRPTVEGLLIKVLHDEPFVSHEPAIGVEGETVMLAKEQCPWEGIAGKWAFASVMPLTKPLLELFPKQVLTLMRGEIYARYGDTFKAAATQSYFDAQPWYKRGTGQGIHLTDIERFNYQLIKQVENSK